MLQRYRHILVLNNLKSMNKLFFPDEKHLKYRLAVLNPIFSLLANHEFL